VSENPDREHPGRNGHPELPLDPDSPPSTPPHLTWAGVGLVFGGGVAGTAARVAVGEAVGPWGAWPAATFCVNVVGAFLLGVLLEALGRRGPDLGMRLRLRLLLGAGFLGAFTTYSTLAVETDQLLRQGYASVAVGYTAGSVVLGFLATMVGIWAAATHHRAAVR
jgi:fluoride exporter